MYHDPAGRRGKRGAPTPPSGALAQKAAAGSPALINVLHMGPRGASKAADSGQPTARPSRRPQPTATQQAMDEAAAQKAENKQRQVFELLKPYGGVCWWCLAAVHDPRGNLCPAKPPIGMDEFEQQAPSKTRAGQALKRGPCAKTTSSRRARQPMSRRWQVVGRWSPRRRKSTESAAWIERRVSCTSGIMWIVSFDARCTRGYQAFNAGVQRESMGQCAREVIAGRRAHTGPQSFRKAVGGQGKEGCLRICVHRAWRAHLESVRVGSDFFPALHTRTIIGCCANMHSRQK